MNYKDINTRFMFKFDVFRKLETLSYVDNLLWKVLSTVT